MRPCQCNTVPAQDRVNVRPCLRETVLTKDRVNVRPYQRKPETPMGMYLTGIHPNKPRTGYKPVLGYAPVNKNCSPLGYKPLGINPC